MALPSRLFDDDGALMASFSEKPDDEPVETRGNAKATREDWLNVATDVLISDGVDQVKVLNLSTRLGVSRSSFYWYFKSRQALLDALLSGWEASNTRHFINACDAPADTITGAVGNLFCCFVDAALFDPQLDFAIRDWARRSGPVRRVVDRADDDRLAAVRRMFVRYGYTEEDAGSRARILYYMQIGYYALELREPIDERLSYIRGYLFGFTGEKPSDADAARVEQYARGAHARANPGYLKTKSDEGD